MTKMKTRVLEKIIKGFSNHRRIEMLELLEKSPELSVLQVADRLKINFKTASEHLRRLTLAGLISKHNVATEVRHSLSTLGRHILKFLRTLE